MRLLWAIVISAIVFTIGMFWIWTSVLQHSGDILEFEYPSRNIEHSISKGIFIDSMTIVSTDTIKTNKYNRVDILPTSSWIEKETYWKSGVMSLDSLGLYLDTVKLIVNFENYVDGKQWTPTNNGYSLVEFQYNNGDFESVYIDDDITQLSFKIFIEQVTDTTRLTTTNNERITITKRTN